MAAMILKEIDRPTLALLGKLDQLTALTLGDWVTDARLEELPPVLTHLQYLSVRAPLVRDRGVATLCRWPALKSLSLDQVSVTDEGLAPLARLTASRPWRVTGTPITGAGLRHLRYLPKLREIVLDGNRLKDFELANSTA